MKAPIVRPTGCPSCGSLGIPGTSCATCVRGAWQTPIREAQARRVAARNVKAPPVGAGITRVLDLLDANRDAENMLAGFVGADLLLDHLGVLLVRVGFEVPS